MAVAQMTLPFARGEAEERFVRVEQRVRQNIANLTEQQYTKAHVLMGWANVLAERDLIEGAKRESRAAMIVLYGEPLFERCPCITCDVRDGNQSESLVWDCEYCGAPLCSIHALRNDCTCELWSSA